jgi:hypothetical protein
MRHILLIAILALGGCATRPDGDQSLYRGVYAPRSTQIADDGRFAARSSVWSVANRAIAIAAARNELRLTAEKAGYTHVVVEEQKVATFFGEQVLITGRLYKRGKGPAKAVPVAMIDFSASIGDPAEQSATPKKKIAKAAKANAVVRPATKPAATPATSPSKSKDDPLVIEAPDFITVVPTPRPVILAQN